MEANLGSSKGAAVGIARAAVGIARECKGLQGNARECKGNNRSKGSSCKAAVVKKMQLPKTSSSLPSSLRVKGLVSCILYILRF